MHHIADWGLTDYMKTGKFKNGVPYMRLKIVRSRDFCTKFLKMRDMTEKKRILKENWLRRKQAHEALFTVIPDEIYAFDEEGNLIAENALVSPNLVTDVTDKMVSIDDTAA